MRRGLDLDSSRLDVLVLHFTRSCLEDVSLLPPAAPQMSVGLYFCASKASKVSAPQVSVGLYFCTSKASKVSTWRASAEPARGGAFSMLLLYTCMRALKASYSSGLRPHT